ncbi:MAG: AI-2E family transporter [Prevotellaceae bacterium]|jgi:predicted PurR-regulated permease PerM|nr:AI-2E family transporter [Prevotellaceae bacterium]
MDSKFTRYIIITAVTAVVIFIAWYFSNIITYILISAVLSIICKPLLKYLSKIHIGKWRMPRWLIATVGLISIWIVAFLFFYFFIPLVANQAKELSNVDLTEVGYHLSQPLLNLESMIQDYIPGAEDFSFNALLSENIASIISVRDVTNVFGSVANMLGSLAVASFSISFITFFFMKEENLFVGGINMLFPKKYERSISRAMNSINKLLMRYFIGVFADAFCVMVVLTIGLTFVAGLSFQTALVIGLIAGVLNVIPYVGPLIAAVIGLIIGTVTHIDLIATGGIGALLIKIGSVFAIMKIMDDTIFQPFIFSNSVKAHPLEIFLVILIAGSIGGILGMLIAIPTYTVLRVFAKEFFNKYRIVQRLTIRM